MKVRIALLMCVAALTGCQDKKTDPAPGVAVQPENLPPKTDPAKPDPAKPDPAKAAAPVAGAIKGKPFKPEGVRLEGTRLEFRVGKEFFADASIHFDLPSDAGTKLEGKSWTFNGQFEAPVVWVSTRTGKDLPKNDFVFGKDHTLALTITKQTKTMIEGTIDLKVKSLPDTHLSGTFTAEAKKAPTDPLDVDDAPYVQGALKFVGPPPAEMVSVGFIGTGADGKEHSNSVGMPIFQNGKPTGGSGTTTTFAPQLTTLIGREKGPPEYRHTHLPPGDHLVYVRVGGVMAAWKRLAVKAGDTLTADLTVDPKTFGEVVVTLPAEEAAGTSEWPLSLAPADAPAVRNHFAFQAAEVKKGQKTVTVKGVPAGKYRAVRGESSADVEVAAGKSAAVTLVRKKE